MNIMRLLFSVLFTSLFSLNCFALVVHHGKVLEHKEWVTGSATGKLLKPIKLLANQQGSGYIDMVGEILPAKGIAGRNSVIVGQSHVFFMNHGSSDKIYDYYTHLCASIDDHTDHCFYSYDKLSVGPKGVVEDDVSPQLQLVFAKPGNYKTNFAATISDGDEVYLTSKAYNSIDVG